jgi:hypothetical protein
VDDSDRPRFLAPVAGYTSRADIAVDPLEAISAEEQRQLTASAHAQERQRLTSEWRRAHAAIDAALHAFRENGHPDRRTLSDLRCAQRTLVRIDERLGI